MITTDVQKRIKAQPCPICGTEQDVILCGTETEDGKTFVNKDAGYSFCNCNNIFFTNWSNMKQDIYDSSYEQRYDSEMVKQCMESYAAAYFPKIQDLTSGRKFLEIGCVNPTLLDCATARGFSRPIGLDIIKHDFHPHETIEANFEDIEDPQPTADVIWASHIFEHFKDPLQAGRKCYDLLNENGILFVAMPDPFMIDWKDPYSWGHWHLREHHILWDMDSFCRAMESVGFKTVMRTRNTSIGFICVADYHLMFQKEAKSV